MVTGIPLILATLGPCPDHLAQLLGTVFLQGSPGTRCACLQSMGEGKVLVSRARVGLTSCDLIIDQSVHWLSDPWFSELEDPLQPLASPSLALPTAA
jgi:hypothetical protein